MSNKKTNVSLLQLSKFLHSFINREKKFTIHCFCRDGPRGSLGRSRPIHGVVIFKVVDLIINTKIYTSCYNEKLTHNNGWHETEAKMTNKRIHSLNGYPIQKDLIILQFNTSNDGWATSGIILRHQVEELYPDVI